MALKDSPQFVVAGLLHNVSTYKSGILVLANIHTCTSLSLSRLPSTHSLLYCLTCTSIHYSDREGHLRLHISRSIMLRDCTVVIRTSNLQSLRSDTVLRSRDCHCRFESRWSYSNSYIGLYGIPKLCPIS